MDCRSGLRHSGIRIGMITRALWPAHPRSFLMPIPLFELQTRRSFAQIGPPNCTLAVEAQHVDLVTASSVFNKVYGETYNSALWQRDPGGYLLVCDLEQQSLC